MRSENTFAASTAGIGPMAGGESDEENPSSVAALP